MSPRSAGCVSDATIYAWRKRFGTLESLHDSRLRQLEQEHARLKKLVTECDLEIEVTREVVAKNGERAGTKATCRVRANVGSAIGIALISINRT